MTLRTISLVHVNEGHSEPAAAAKYAVRLAETFGAHLSVCIGVPPLAIVMADVSPGVLAMIEDDNVARRASAQRFIEQIRAEASLRGVPTDTEVVSTALEPVIPRVLRAAKSSDLSVVQAPDGAGGLQRELITDLVMTSGTPALLIPSSWARATPSKVAVVAWDGGGPAARAVRDAMPMLERAGLVEVVSIQGEKPTPKEAAGAGLVTHVSRHCRKVEASLLPMQQRNVAATIRQHAHLVHADLIVMGAYGHSRLREFILGGVTRDMLTNIEIPTLLAH